MHCVSHAMPLDLSTHMTHTELAQYTLLPSLLLRASGWYFYIMSQPYLPCQDLTTLPPPGRQLPLPGAARSAASRSDAIDSLPSAYSQSRCQS
jgi:hypothetical protein